VDWDASQKFFIKGLMLLALAAGLEYDLDLFNIVAVDDFNMGAMENKSLNIFNSRLVIASPATSTDQDYSRVEGVVGHEYFHNWTGNRVTCRDWFQLTLKEGLTVFRDQVGCALPPMLWAIEIFNLSLLQCTDDVQERTDAQSLSLYA